MKTPQIKYYACMAYDPSSGKTPKYTITKAAGYYPPMETIKGKGGSVSMFLMEKTPSSDKSSTPSMRLQAKDSLNFTGLKDYFVEGKMSGFAYGYPLQSQTYSAKEKPNPFYEYRNDAFLFVVQHDPTAAAETDRQRPTQIELIVLDSQKVLAAAYCKMLKEGGFDEALAALRKQSF